MDNLPEPPTLDCRGLKCPMPIVKVAQAAKGLGPGELLRVVATDPGFKADIQAWAKVSGHDLVAVEATGDGQRATIRKR